jgi:hypothetical protein
MSKRIRKERYLSDCQVTAETIPTECPIITTEISSTNVPSQKRKEKAKRIIYLKRI